MSSSYAKNLLFIVLTVVLSGSAVFGQNSDFTYQGRLTDGGTPANGNYDLQFALFNGAAGGVQIGQSQSFLNVPVSGGIFTVSLNFGPGAFPGPNRFLEISMRPSGATAFTLLTPRQWITATPYAVRSLNATSADTAANAQMLDGVAAAQYVKTDDARLADARDPKAGSSNYVQNTSSQQANTNFNISGNGTAGGTLSGNNVNAATQYNLGGQRVLGTTGGTALTIGGVGPVEVDAPGQFGGRFTIRENGNVGIGTRFPASRLQVGGTVESSSGGFKFPDGSVQSSAANPAIGKAFVNSSITEVEIVNSNNVSPIISVTLPPGIYLITATVHFENRANDFLQNNTRHVRCFLVNDFGVTHLGASGSPMDSTVVTMHTLLNQQSGQNPQVSLSCGNTESGGKVFAKARRITAVRVADNPQ